MNLVFNPATQEGILEKKIELVVPNDDEPIEDLLQEVTTDYICLSFPSDAQMDSYVIQRLVIGSQQVSQVERDW